MTDAQLYGFFSIPRNSDGSPSFPNPFIDDDVTPEKVYKRMLWMQGITDKKQQADLWRDEVKRRGRSNRQRDIGEAGPSFDDGP